jgi:hypothetical protein
MSDSNDTLPVVRRTSTSENTPRQDVVVDHAKTV